MKQLTPIDIVRTALEDKKAEDIAIIDVHNITSVCDNMVIASGSSTQKVRALAENVRDEAKSHGIEVLGVEGMENREWVLIDLGNVLVHIMLPEIRTYYELEKLWSVEAD